MSLKCKAELLVRGATVITMDDPVKAEKLDFAVNGGRFLAVGPAGELDGLKGPETKVVDGQGGVVMPGLIDSHNHMVTFGRQLQDVEVSQDAVSDMDGLCRAVAQRAAQTPAGQWVRAWGYQERFLAENLAPTRDFLDKAAPDHPVYVTRACGHVMAVNSRALELAGITEDTPDPEGGELGRDENGRLNGLLKELGAMNMVNRLLPVADATGCAAQLEAASRVYASQGLTTVCEAGAGWTGNPQEVPGFQLACREGRLLQRVCLGVMEASYNLLPGNGGLGLASRFGGDKLWLGPAKFVADGGLGARTAAMNSPYEGSDYLGVMCEEAGDLAERMGQVHDAGWQISIHAIGDRTMDMVLDCFSRILKKNPRPHRHRIEHASVCPAEQVKRVAELGLSIVVQPAFLYYQADSYVANLGMARTADIKPVRSLLEAGITVAGSSDRPVTEGNPWTGIWAALNRTTLGGVKIAPGQEVDRIQALKMWTRAGSWVNLAEDRIGSITPGKLADFIVIDRNPLDCPLADVAGTKVLKTYLGGKKVFAA